MKHRLFAIGFASVFLICAVIAGVLLFHDTNDNNDVQAFYAYDVRTHFTGFLSSVTLGGQVRVHGGPANVTLVHSGTFEQMLWSMTLTASTFYPFVVRSAPSSSAITIDATGQFIGNLVQFGGGTGATYALWRNNAGTSSRMNFGTIDMSVGHFLNLAVHPAGTGTVSQSGALGAGQNVFMRGEQGTISASPATNWRFSHWEHIADPGTTIANPTAATTTTTMGTHHATIVAVFAPITHTVFPTVNPAGAGWVSGEGVHHTFQQGTSGHGISAGPSTGWHFTHWSVAGAGTVMANANAATTSFTMGTQNATITANFARNVHAVTVTTGGGGTVSGTGNLAFGLTRVLGATPSAGMIFTHWTISGSGTLNNPNIPNATLTQGNAATTVTAHFARQLNARVRHSDLFGITAAQLPSGQAVNAVFGAVTGIRNNQAHNDTNLGFFSINQNAAPLNNRGNNAAGANMNVNFLGWESSQATANLGNVRAGWNANTTNNHTISATTPQNHFAVFEWVSARTLTIIMNDASFGITGIPNGTVTNIRRPSSHNLHQIVGNVINPSVRPTATLLGFSRTPGGPIDFPIGTHTYNITLASGLNTTLHAVWNPGFGHLPPPMENPPENWEHGWNLLRLHFTEGNATTALPGFDLNHTGSSATRHYDPQSPTSRNLPTTAQMNTWAATQPAFQNRTFQGWYTNPNFTIAQGQQVTQIPAGHSGVLRFYARWG